MVWFWVMRLQSQIRHPKWALLWPAPTWNLCDRQAHRHKRQASCRQVARSDEVIHLNATENKSNIWHTSVGHGKVPTESHRVLGAALEAGEGRYFFVQPR